MSQQVLMIIGVTFLGLIAVGIIYFAIQVATVRKLREKPSEQPAVVEDTLAQLHARYGEAADGLNVPANALTLKLACNNYVSGGAALKHYCWLSGDEMLFFPVWEDLEAVISPLDAPNIFLREWRVPIKDIICFANEQGLANKFVVLQYKKESGVINLAFAEDASKIFSTLLPDKDFSHLLEELYPKSSRNIRDIKESFASLLELHKDGLITDEEYAAKKKEMLISL